MTPLRGSQGRQPLTDRPGLLASLVTAAVGCACAGAATIAAGRGGLLGALVAVVVVLAFFGSGAVPLRLAELAALPVRAGLGLVLLTYAMRLVVVLGLLAAVSTVEGIHHPSLGLTLIACALVWPLVRLVAVVTSARYRAPETPPR